MNTAKKSLGIKALSVIAILFGFLTIKEGASALFTEEGRLAAGNYVPFVLWFNFLAGFFYVIAGIGIYRLKTYSKHLSKLIAVATLIVFLLFGIHIFNNGLFETRTIIAMTVRSSLWIVISIALRNLK